MYSTLPFFQGKTQVPFDPSLPDTESPRLVLESEGQWVVAVDFKTCQNEKSFWFIDFLKTLI